jgi:hypothetical protein
MIIGQIKDDEVGICGRDEKYVKMLVGKPERRDHSGDLAIERGIIIEMLLMEPGMRM